MSGFSVVARSGSGVVVGRKAVRIGVSAVREDVFRVRIGRAGVLPADESWAVLGSVRAGGVEVEIEEGEGFVVCRTGEASVRIGLEEGGVAIFDALGREVLADRGAAFREEEGGFVVRKTLRADVRIFGLGDKPGPLDRRGYAYVNWATDTYAFQEGQGPLYKDIPFFIGYENGRGFGVLFDNTWRKHFDFGLASAQVLSFGAAGGEIDYYVMAGPTPKDVVRAYAWLTGAPPLPPKWALGYQQCRYSYETAVQAREIVRDMRAYRIPCDVIWFDLHVLDRNRSFTTSPTAFPDFPAMVAEFHELGVRTVLIADLHIAQVPHGYAPYRVGREADAFVKGADGGEYVAKAWGGASVFPDFSWEPAARYWGDLFREAMDQGVDGFWNDMNEPSVFEANGTFAPEVRHRIGQEGFEARETSHAEMHNVYGMLNGRATYEGMLRHRPSLRPFVMMRASYAGGHRYAVTWTGDNVATWGHLRVSTPMLLSLGLGGFAFSGVNLGGFVGSSAPELLTAWLQVGMFNPIAENHSDLNTRMQEPWVDGEGPLAVRRAAIEGRYRLLPYLYTLAEEASRTGMPLMRPLFLEFPEAAGGLVLDRQAPSHFMLGEALLVAPPPYAEWRDAYDVLLPPGRWYEYWEGGLVEDVTVAKMVGNSGTAQEMEGDAAHVPHVVRIVPREDRVAVFARAGTIVPHQAVVQHVGEVPEGPLRIAVYAGERCVGTVYDDDGESFAYRRGGFLRVGFEAVFGEGGFVVRAGAREGSFAPWWREIEVSVFGVEGEVELEGAEYDAGRRVLRFVVPDRAEGWEVTVKERQLPV